MTLTAEYLKSEHERERVLACKLIPCLKRSLTKAVTTRLILLMWYDMSRTVRKVASQTLGRTGRGKIVHDEIYARIAGEDVFEKMQVKDRSYSKIISSVVFLSYCSLEQFCEV